MYLFKDIGKLLDEIVDELPAPLLDRLNGGINLVYESKHNKRILSSDYWVLGEYCCDSLGRRIYKKNAQKAHSVRGGMNAHKLNKPFMYVFPFCDIIET